MVPYLLILCIRPASEAAALGSVSHIAKAGEVVFRALAYRLDFSPLKVQKSAKSGIVLCPDPLRVPEWWTKPGGVFGSGSEIRSWTMAVLVQHDKGKRVRN